MTGYHLRRMVRPRLLVVVSVLVFVVWYGFRPGGPEVGDGPFGLHGIAHYCVVVATALLILLAPFVGGALRESGLRAAWRLSSAGTVQIARDSYAIFLALFVVYLLILGGCAAYAAFRVAAGGVWLATLAVVLGVGPVLGGYVWLGLGYVVGAISGSAVARLLVIWVACVLDAVNQLPFAALSVSGTSKTVAERGGWAVRLVGHQLTHVALPAPAFLRDRLLLAVAVTALVVGAAWWRRPGRDARGQP